MHKLSSIIFLFFYIGQVNAQSPHGSDFQVDCASCHNPASWIIDIDTFHFNHDTMNFVLASSHLTVDCKACHTTLAFSEAPMDCISCHTDVHSMSVGNDCMRCHSSGNWLIDDIPELHEENGFPLVGNHGTLSCVDCHISENNLRFDRIGNDCINCHSDNFNQTTSPNHIAVGFSNNCIECHDPLSTGWETDIINHDFFPLILGHDIQNCAQCHTTDNFSDASPDCINCHQSNFENTTSPDHEIAQFSTDCNSCHTLDPGWMPASFDHNAFYPLVGAHDLIASNCIECHANGFSNTPNTCVGCHLVDYNSAMDPDHRVSGFPTDCNACHSETAWTPATFDHDGLYFPIYSGKHRGEWNDCIECHTTPGNYTAFSCIDCHEHNNKNEVDDDHDEVSGYLYQSNACLSCHPSGED